MLGVPQTDLWGAEESSSAKGTPTLFLFCFFTLLLHWSWIKLEESVMLFKNHLHTIALQNSCMFSIVHLYHRFVFNVLIYVKLLWKY